MTRRRWLAVGVLFAAAAAVMAWVWTPRRLPEERIIAERLRAAKALYVKMNLGNQEFFGPERLSLDQEALAKRFRLKKKRGHYTVSSSISVTLSADSGTVLRLCPPTCCFIDDLLYSMEPGFWTELLRQAPQTKAWLLEKMPLSFEYDEPIDR